MGTVGEPLSSISLAHYNSSAGRFSWKDPDEIISDFFHGFGLYWMLFTPAGANTYTEETAVIVIPRQ